MDAEMACSEFSMKDMLGDVMSLIDDAVSAYRNRGLPRTIATEQASVALGITPRRAKSLLYGESFKVTGKEYRAISEAYVRHLDDEAAYFVARLDAVKTRRRQFTMDRE